MQQQQTRADINMKEPMQQKQRQHEMMHMQQDQRGQPINSIAPSNKNPQREPQRDNWYRDDWFSRQDNTWQQGAQQRTDHRYGQYPGDYRNRRRSPSPERGWEVDLGGGGGYYSHSNRRPADPFEWSQNRSLDRKYVSQYDRPDDLYNAYGGGGMNNSQRNSWNSQPNLLP